MTAKRQPTMRDVWASESNPKLASKTRSTRNTAFLVHWLRFWAHPELRMERPILSPELAKLLADILDGTLKATYRQRTIIASPDPPTVIRVAIEKWRRDLELGHKDAVKRAHKLGYSDDEIFGGRRRRTIARHIQADYWKMSPRALDEHLNPRAGRGKRG